MAGAIGDAETGGPIGHASGNDSLRFLRTGTARALELEHVPARVLASLRRAPGHGRTSLSACAGPRPREAPLQVDVLLFAHIVSTLPCLFVYACLPCLLCLSALAYLYTTNTPPPEWGGKGLDHTAQSTSSPPHRASRLRAPLRSKDIAPPDSIMPSGTAEGVVSQTRKRQPGSQRPRRLH